MMPGLSDLYRAFDSDPAPIVAFLEHLTGMYGLSQPLRALDIGCGPGRLLGPLERLRWEVTGMEPNPEFVAAARSLAASSRRVTVRRGGFLDLQDQESFDLAAAINSSFAHLVAPSDRGDAVQRIFEALRPGGVVFLDLPNSLWILANYQAPAPHASTVQGLEVTLHRRQEIDLHDALIITTDEYIFAGERRPRVELVHTYGIFGFPEIRHHLREAGFEDVRTFNGYHSRAPERLDGPRMLVTARKPDA